MAAQVHIYPKIERQLASLEKQEKAPCIAAARARRIIDALIRGMRPASSGLLKRKTDKRLKNSLKFDLGSGFRLICVEEGEIIHVLFIGDHDNCDNWLDNYSKKKPHKKQLELQSYTIDTGGTAMSVTPSHRQETSIDDPGFPQISQEALRQVFKGLTG